MSTQQTSTARGESQNQQAATEPAAAPAAGAELVLCGLEQAPETAGISQAAEQAAQIQAHSSRKPARTGAPIGNRNAIKHGKRAAKLVLGSAPPGDEYLFYEVNKLRKDWRAKVIAKYGEITGIQEAKVVSACDWEISRQLHHQLARAATGAERSKELNAKAECGERRNRCLEQAGLTTASSNGRASSTGLHHNGIMLPDDVLAALEAPDSPTDAADAAGSVYVAATSEEADA